MVYYATPEFHLCDILQKHYQSDNILENSAIFDVKEMPLYGSGYHSLVYRPDSDFGMMFSEPSEIKKSPLPEPEKFGSGKISKPISDVAERIYSVLITNGYIEDIDINNIQEIALFKAVHNILLSKFNILWFPIFPEPTTKETNDENSAFYRYQGKIRQKESSNWKG